jgi:dimethlysulfoniopropionate lyase
MRSSAALDRCLAAVVRRLPPEGFAEAVQALRGGGAPRTAPPGRASLSVLSHWPRALEGVASIDAELGEALADMSSALAWRQNPNYLRRPPGPGFLDGYGYAVIAGPGGLIQAGIALGILLLAPRILYPAHAHPAEEVYLVLDAQSRWWREGEPWRERIGGAAIHHPPHLPHAMQAGPSMPLCAIYLWRGDLATNAALTGAPHLTET